jgi:hypothetical protein
VTIPRILHQIWLGPRPVPVVWTRTWHEMNPDFEYRLLTDDAVDGFGLRYNDVYRRFVGEGIYDGAADVGEPRSSCGTAVCTWMQIRWHCARSLTRRS